MKFIKEKICLFRGFFRLLEMACLSISMLHSAMADIGVPGEQYKMPIHMHGSITASGGCKFTNKLTPIDFGEVYYSSMSGSNKIRTTVPLELDIGMDCTEDFYGAATMILTPGKGTIDYQGAKLMQVIDDSNGAVSKDLAIRLLVNSTEQNIDEAFTVDVAQPQGPKLEVELVQIGNGKSFSTGATFSGAATLTFTYL